MNFLSHVITVGDFLNEDVGVQKPSIGILAPMCSGTSGALLNALSDLPGMRPQKEGQTSTPPPSVLFFLKQEFGQFNIEAVYNRRGILLLFGGK